MTIAEKDKLRRMIADGLFPQAVETIKNFVDSSSEPIKLSLYLDTFYTFCANYRTFQIEKIGFVLDPMSISVREAQFKSAALEYLNIIPTTTIVGPAPLPDVVKPEPDKPIPPTNDEIQKLIQEQLNRTRLIEDAAWASAKETHTAASYAEFIDQFPYSRMLSEAEKQLSTISQKANDKIAWDKAVKENTVQAFHEYLHSNPGGGYKQQAQETLDKLLELEKWNDIKKQKDIDLTSSFIQTCTNWQIKAEAKDLLDTLEAGLWSAATLAGSTAMYKHYMIKFPTGKHIDEANTFLSDAKAIQEIAEAEKYFQMKRYSEAEKLIARHYNSHHMHGKLLAKLGWIYVTGATGKVDYTRSITAYNKALSRGDKTVLTELGTFYERGLGVSVDTKKAFLFYKDSAEQGEIDGVYHLGRMYEQGSGIQADARLANQLFTLAANAGHPKAKEKLK